MDNSLDLTLKDWSALSTGLRLNGPPRVIEPDPLHLEHAINLKSPHLLHMPNELLVQENAQRNLTGVIHQIASHFNFS